jgi:hypothetical protein
MSLEICTLIDDVLVPVESEPLHSLEDCAGTLIRAADFVGVFDAKKEFAVVMPGIEPVEKRCTRPANVQVPSW